MASHSQWWCTVSCKPGPQEKLEFQLRSTPSLRTPRMGTGLAIGYKVLFSCADEVGYKVLFSCVDEVGYKVLFSCADEVSAETEVNFSKAIGGRGKHSHKSKEIRNFGGCIGRMKSRRAWLKFTLVRVEVEKGMMGNPNRVRRPLRAQLMVPGFHGREQGCAVVGHESLWVCW